MDGLEGMAPAGAEDASVDQGSMDQGEQVEGIDELEAAVEAGDLSPTEAQILKKRLKIVVDGKEYDEEVDFNDEKKLKEHLQKAKAFDSRSREVAQMKSQMDILAQKLKENPEEVLAMMGHDVSGFAEKIIARKIEELQKSPEELEREQLRKELEDYKKKEQEASKKAQEAEMEKLRNQQAQQIETDITSALDEAGSILPRKNPRIYQKIAGTMIMAIKQGYHDVTVKDVLPIVENEYRQEIADIFGNSSDEILEQLVKKERLDSYRKNKIAAAKKVPKTKQVVDTGMVSETKEKKPQKKQVDLSDFMKNLNKK